MVDPATRAEQLVASYSAPSLDVAQLLCDRHPGHAVAARVIGEDLAETTVTYAELSESSRRFAAVLSERGIGRGDRVATLMGKSVDLLTVLVGIWRVGAVYVPLFTAFAEAAVTDRLRRSQTRLVIVDPDQRHKIGDGAWVVLPADEVASEVARAQPWEPRSVAVGGAGALVHMFTSGTTGSPKGVVHPAAYIGGWHSYQEFGLGVGAGSVFWSAADPGWAYGLYTAIVAPLAAGIPTVLLRGGFSAEATQWVLAELKVTNFAAAPTAYRGLRNSGQLQPGTLDVPYLSSAGEPLTPDVNVWAPEALGARVHDHYGQTEVGMPIGFPHHEAVAVPVVDGAMGVALPGWSATVLAPDRDEPAEPGTVGRLALVVADSPFMTFTAYADGDDHGRFVGDGRYYVTGDTASIDVAGIVRFSSRDDDVIIMAGYRIGPFDVESVLAQHPAVAECAVIAAPDETRGEVVEAYVVAAPGSAVTEDELRRWVKDRYSAHAYPRRVHFVASLPKTPSGKIQRAELRRQRRAEVLGGRGSR
ncbi:AMP-binding protein [Pseudofrankia inefficax]|uniref:AMP-dependent synthetase and ligase n=1 Tax=Pseudofrankia inefficax (strain DSM 45817 / CECT 9037 / DDB 130130 / EuI1c) TaxID=298654 RepID=E3J9A3_PSEI1|nr:AMP-binding protein [Pseudofrankia inefficax]ADP82122.1 AMP-dependent synthetase and ligase [Pseudofrankia inefficax]